MCSNYQPIKNHHANWVNEHFYCNLPDESWREETYPTYTSPFVFLNEGKPVCKLAQFGLVPHWASDKKKFGLRTYNARTETVFEKPSYRTAWREKRFGLVLVESFYEPNWETGKSIRWKIKRADDKPTAIASIWERIIDKETGEILLSFSMLTINADGNEIMKHFHKPEDEKRSVVVIQETDYLRWLNADHDEARGLFKLAPDGYLVSSPSPK